MNTTRKTTLSAFIVTFILCAVFWVILTGSFAAQELIAGALASALVAWFSAKFFVHHNAFWLFHPGRFFSLIYYCLVVFMWELIKANVSMARYALSPKLKINPGIVRVPVSLESEYGLAMLADSITLTPGTITMDIEQEEGKTWFYIHWIDVTQFDRDKAGDDIKGTLEKWVGRIWK